MPRRDFSYYNEDMKVEPVVKKRGIKHLIGFHEWKLESESTRFATNIRKYVCECGKEKTTYQPFGFEKETEF